MAYEMWDDLAEFAFWERVVIACAHLGGETAISIADKLILLRRERIATGPVAPVAPVAPVEQHADDPLNHEVTELEISGRAENCLLYNDIRTIGQLVQHSEKDLMRLTNFGNVCLRDVKEALARQFPSLPPLRKR